MRFASKGELRCMAATPKGAPKTLNKATPKSACKCTYPSVGVEEWPSPSSTNPTVPATAIG